MSFSTIRNILLPFVAVAFSLQALAAETDNFTAKKINLPDQSTAINKLANSYLKNAIVAANQSASDCNEEVLYKALRQVYANHSKGLMVQDMLAQKHFPVMYLKRENSIYKNWKDHDGFVLATSIRKFNALALSPLVKVGQQDVGVDKFEHMFGMGYGYFNSYYKDNKTIDQVLGNGVTWEKTLLGGNIIATGVFSYADLSANFNGMRFWNNMLMQHDDILGAQYNRGPYVQCVGNRWEVNSAKPINFKDYIDASYDESVNCSKFATRNGYKKIKKEVYSAKFSTMNLCESNTEILEKLVDKYSPHGINKYMLNLNGLGVVNYFNEIK